MFGRRSRFSKYRGPVVSNNRMFGSPTVRPAEGVQNTGLGAVTTDPYFTLEVDTTDASLTGDTQIVLFDPSAGFQNGFSYFMPAAVDIRGLTATYQFMLNDLAIKGSYFDIIKQTVRDDAGATVDGLAQTQFLRSVEIFHSSKGSKPRLLKTMHPSMGIHEGQFQLSINTYASPTVLDHSTALVYNQVQGVIVTWAFYQKAEIGAKI